MIKYNTPQELFTAICDKIRSIDNTNELINHQDIPDKINVVCDNIKLFIDSAIQKDLGDKYYNFNNTITKVYSKIFAGTNLQNIDLSKCTYICNSAFEGCSQLNIVNLDLPECTYIGNDAFYSCTSLTTVNLPECTTIGWMAFINTNVAIANLPKLNTAYTGPGFSSYGAFYGCTNLTTVIFGEYFSSHIPNIFGNTPIEDGTGYIYVPDNVLNEYRSNNPDYQFKPISELPSNLKEEYGYE